MSQRKNHSPEFTAKVALEALNGAQTDMEREHAELRRENRMLRQEEGVQVEP